jgi:hypothetical protein
MPEPVEYTPATIFLRTLRISEARWSVKICVREKIVSGLVRDAADVSMLGVYGSRTRLAAPLRLRNQPHDEIVQAKELCRPHAGIRGYQECIRRLILSSSPNESRRGADRYRKSNVKILRFTVGKLLSCPYVVRPFCLMRLRPNSSSLTRMPSKSSSDP